MGVDPLLVQAGRVLVTTPYAEEIGARVHALQQDTRAILTPVARRLEPATFERSFSIRANEGFLALFSAALVEAVLRAAPRVRLRFTPKPDKDVGPLRNGQIDLEIGTAGTSGPEMRTRLLFRDRFVGLARSGHPLLTGPITPARYAAFGHVVASRRGAVAGPVDEALSALGLKREVAVVVPGFPDALNIARRSDLIALVPRSCLGDAASMDDLRAFDLPVATPALAISLMWHPRLDADTGHHWLREMIVAVCQRVRE